MTFKPISVGLVFIGDAFFALSYGKGLAPDPKFIT